MPRARLGVALLVPAPLATEIDGLRRAVGDPALGRIPPHLTLVPPVNVAEARLAEALAVVRQAASRAAPILVELGPPRTFLPDNPVLYLGVGGDDGPIRALRDSVLREPLARAAAWPFVPHVTLADEASPEALESALVALGRYRVEARFDRLHLLRQGPDRVWVPIAEAPLRPPAVIGRGGLPLEVTVSDHLDAEAPPELRPFAVTARRSGEVAGAASGLIHGHRAVLDRLVVDAAHRRQGIGSHLLAAVASLAAQAGCSTLSTGTTPGPEGQAFLRARGWTPGLCFHRDLDVGAAAPDG